MKTHQDKFIYNTPGRGIYNITDQVASIVANANIETGLCNVFLHHTSASLIICENNDPDVQTDLQAFFTRLAPDGDPIYKHIEEGPDDMSAHVRTVITHSSISIPITDKKMALGTWQGIYLWEHRIKPYDRKITVTIQG